MLNDIDRFHKTPIGYIVFGVAELALSYSVALRAIDTGNLWMYAITILLFIGGISNFVRLVRDHVEFVHKSHEHHKKPHKKA